MGLGRRLAGRAIDFARSRGYRSMVRDTLPAMKDALAPYRKFGFKPCAPYHDDAAIGSKCLELALAG